MEVAWLRPSVARWLPQATPNRMLGSPLTGSVHLARASGVAIVPMWRGTQVTAGDFQ